MIFMASEWQISGSRLAIASVAHRTTFLHSCRGVLPLCRLLANHLLLVCSLETLRRLVLKQLPIRCVTGFEGFNGGSTVDSRLGTAMEPDSRRLYCEPEESSETQRLEAIDPAFARRWRDASRGAPALT